jgi:hypothetical protein
MAAAWVWVFFAGVAWFALGAFISVETMSGPVEFVGLGVTTTYTRVDCAPPPLLSSATNRSAFLQDLLPLLAALPAAVATTPLGFASLQSGGASVRGLCLGATLEKECVACLAAAAENLTGCFLGASRRGGVWIGDGCFLAYADANSSSAREDAFRDVVLAGQDPGAGPNCFDPPMLVVPGRRGATGAAVLLGCRRRARARGRRPWVQLLPASQDVGPAAARDLQDEAK